MLAERARRGLPSKIVVPSTALEGPVDTLLVGGTECGQAGSATAARPLAPSLARLKQSGIRIILLFVWGDDKLEAVYAEAKRLDMLGRNIFVIFSGYRCGAAARVAAAPPERGRLAGCAWALALSAS